jgi:NAD(P)-dependent dehydrogenase (short-subunit alcohol dehydrogenase family)
MKRFEGKTVAVTGGGSGIGEAMSRRFAEEGARVVVVERDASAGERVAGDVGAELVACDVGDHAAVHAALGSREIHVLVNNAGIAHIGTLETTSEEDFDRIQRVNVKGVYNCLHAVVPGMVARGGGVILNLCSVAAKVGLADRFAYSTSKGAVLTMTLSVAKDYLAKGIRCNCICPARVHTPFVDQYLARNYPGREAEMFAKLSAAQPIGRMAEPGEVAALAVYLCSDDASFVTGMTWDIDGGYMNLR